MQYKACTSQPQPKVVLGRLSGFILSTLIHTRHAKCRVQCIQRGLKSAIWDPMRLSGTRGAFTHGIFGAWPAACRMAITIARGGRGGMLVFRQARGVSNVMDPEQRDAACGRDTVVGATRMASHSGPDFSEILPQAGRLKFAAFITSSCDYCDDTKQSARLSVSSGRRELPKHRSRQMMIVTRNLHTGSSLPER